MLARGELRLSGLSIGEDTEVRSCFEPQISLAGSGGYWAG